jgi:hypothetical protein
VRGNEEGRKESEESLEKVSGESRGIVKAREYKEARIINYGFL